MASPRTTMPSAGLVCGVRYADRAIQPTVFAMQGERMSNEAPFDSMNKLAALLQKRGDPPATPATPATHEPKSSNCSKSSSGSTPICDLPRALERRIYRMADRWQYTDDELAEVLALARANPAGWLRAVALDERREAEFRRAGLLPRADA